MLTPVDHTPETFERYLPYALALDVEQQWSENFADVLERTDASGQPMYQPVWFSGEAWHSTGFSTLGSSLSGAFASAIAASSVAPGTSSGFSSGGGGGAVGVVVPEAAEGEAEGEDGSPFSARPGGWPSSSGHTRSRRHRSRGLTDRSTVSGLDRHRVCKRESPGAGAADPRDDRGEHQQDPCAGRPRSARGQPRDSVVACPARQRRREPCLVAHEVSIPQPTDPGCRRRDRPRSPHAGPDVHHGPVRRGRSIQGGPHLGCHRSLECSCCASCRHHDASPGG